MAFFVVAGDSCATSFLQWRNIVSIVKPLNLFSLVAFVLETAALAFAHSWKLGFSTMFFLFLIFLFSYFFFSFDPCLTLFMSILKWLDVFIVSKTFWSFVWSYYIAESLNIREKALLSSNVSNNHFHKNCFAVYMWPNFHFLITCHVVNFSYFASDHLIHPFNRKPNTTIE